MVNKAKINQQYDLSELEHGFLFSERLNNQAMKYLLYPIVATFFILQIIAQKKGYNSVFGIVSVGAYLSLFGVVVLYVFWSSVRDFFYRRARTKFGEVNMLRKAEDDQLAGDVPQSAQTGLKVSNEKAVGFIFDVGGIDVKIFDYTYVTGSFWTKDHKSYYFAIATLELKKKYPHLYLDSKHNGHENLYARSQKVQLEGNFNKDFTLYIPEGSQLGALTVFSPDIMAQLMDNGRNFDLEIDGNTASFITKDYAFTRENLKSFLNCAAVIGRELNELDATWQPVHDTHGKQFKLRRSSAWVALATVLVYFVIAQVVGYIAKHLIK